MRYILAISSWAAIALMAACTNTGRWTPRNTVVDQTYVHKYGVEVPSDYWSSGNIQMNIFF